MLALTRKAGQAIYIYGSKGEQIARIEVVKIFQRSREDRVTLSFDAPLEYSIVRDDAFIKERQENDTSEDQ